MSSGASKLCSPLQSSSKWSTTVDCTRYEICFRYNLFGIYINKALQVTFVQVLLRKPRRTYVSQFRRLKQHFKVQAQIRLEFF